MYFYPTPPGIFEYQNIWECAQGPVGRVCGPICGWGLCPCAVGEQARWGSLSPINTWLPGSLCGESQVCRGAATVGRGPWARVCAEVYVRHGCVPITVAVHPSSELGHNTKDEAMFHQQSQEGGSWVALDSPWGAEPTHGGSHPVPAPDGPRCLPQACRCPAPPPAPGQGSWPGGSLPFFQEGAFLSASFLQPLGPLCGGRLLAVGAGQDRAEGRSQPFP